MWLFVALVVLIRADESWGFAAGAPRSTCRTMLPDHGRHITPRTTNQPYHIEISPKYYKEGDQIQVKLVQNGTGHAYVGVLLEARYTDPSKLQMAVGKFRINPSDMGTLKLVCYDAAISHKNNRRTESTEVTWVAPTMGTGNIVFKASVVQDYNKIWLGIESPVLTYGDAPPEPEGEAGAAGELASGGSCLPESLDALPAVDVVPGVAILCGSFEQCPRNWRCCQQCSLGEDGQEVCAGYAICRKPKKEEKDSAESDEIAVE